MELFRVERTIAQKERIRAAALQHDDEEPQEEGEEEGLFVTQDGPDEFANRQRRKQFDRPLHNEDSDDDINDLDDADKIMNAMLQSALEGDVNGGPELTKGGKPRKKRAKAPKNAREAFQREEEKRIAKERTKAQKKKGRGAASTSKCKPPAKGKGKAASKKTA